jgi:hypothetical protein
MKVEGSLRAPHPLQEHIDEEAIRAEDLVEVDPIPSNIPLSHFSKGIEHEGSFLELLELGPEWCYVENQKMPTDYLIEQILLRRKEIREQKEHWSESIQTSLDEPFGSVLKEAISTGHLETSKEGSGAAYVLYNKDHIPLFIVKPVDEEILCLNNHKSFACPFLNDRFRARDYIPLYRSAQTDLLCYRVAKLLGIEKITPRLSMQIMQSQHFYDLTLSCQDPSHPLHNKIGTADYTKLCSVQEYIDDAIPMSSQIYQWLSAGYTPKQIQDGFDPIDFEEANLFIWVTYDTDAHPGNFLVYKSEGTEASKGKLQIKKIDNSLSFPEYHSQFMNFLMFIDVEKAPLSNMLKQKIESLPIEQIAVSMAQLEMSTATIIAFIQRVNVLKELARRSTISIYEMNLRLSLLAQPDGIHIALSEQSLTDLELLLQKQKPQSTP